MTHHARSLRGVVFLRNQGIGKAMRRPGDDLVSAESGIMEADLGEFGFHSSTGDCHRIRRNRQACGRKMRRGPRHPVGDERRRLIADRNESRPFESIRPVLSGQRNRRGQRQRKFQFRLEPFVQSPLRIRAHVEWQNSLRVLPVRSNRKFRESLSGKVPRRQRRSRNQDSRHHDDRHGRRKPLRRGPGRKTPRDRRMGPGGRLDRQPRHQFLFGGSWILLHTGGGTQHRAAVVALCSVLN